MVCHYRNSASLLIADGAFFDMRQELKEPDGTYLSGFAKDRSISIGAW